MTDLAGRLVLLTGASSGVGPVIARRLRREGARFVLSGRDEARLVALARELGDAVVIPADLARRGEAERLADVAGDVDVLVANAGVPASGALVDLDVPSIDHALDVNIRAPLVLTYGLLPGMLERRAGHVVLIGSMSGRVPAARSSVYSATKFAVRGFGHALRAELRGTGVGVSIVSPTLIAQVGMWAETGLQAPVRQTTPDRVAEACVRAIRRDVAEIVVAPVEQRVFSSIVLAIPGRMQRFLAMAATTPETVEAHRSKR
jgi:short-subunit dehydrogenase